MKNLTLKLAALLLVFFFAVNAVDAQVLFVDDDYEQYDANVLAPTNIDYVTLRGGTSVTMGYYALPDPIYHPNYNNGGGWALTADFVWNWTLPTNPGTAGSITYPVATFPANYVQVTYTATGVYAVNVAEAAPAAFGGCTDASPTVMNVTVVSPPTGTISILPGVGWQEITPNASYQICGNQLGETVTISFNEAIPDAFAAYAFQITETIERIDGANGIISTPQAEAVIQNFPAGTKLQDLQVGGLTGAAFNRATPAFAFTFTSAALDVNTGARTRYTYRVTRTGDIGANGFFSAISEKSDYLASLSYYNFTNQAVSFIVNPAPVTGPIYHIPNGFAL